MPLISEQLPNLMNGVSQQALTMRMASQCEAQINGLSSLVSGNVKRPPTKFLAKVRDGTSEGAHVHTINRDASEQYTVISEDREVRVYDLAGNEKTVTYPDGTDYLVSSDPKTDFRAVTVADYTFFVNRNIEVETLPDLSLHNSNAALLFIKSSSYEITYKVRLNGDLAASYTTDASDASDPDIKIDTIAAALLTQINAYLATNSLTSQYSVINKSPVIWIKRVDGATFTLEFADDDGGDMTDVIRDKVQRFTDLPVKARKDHVVAVTGDDTSAFDDYFLKFIPDNTSLWFDDGVWEETVAPNVLFALDPATMPHVLVRQSDGTFQLKQQEYGERVAGDWKSAKFPSFVGNKISDVYFDRRRLCFLSSDNVTMSQRDEFFNFMPTTVLQILDDDRIDVSTTGTEVANLNHAVPFNQKILLFSDQVQYVIDDEYLLASNPPGIDHLSDYESSGSVSPVTAGKTLFMPVNRGDWAGVLEYYVIKDTDTTEAADITEHIPRYIPAPVTSLASSPSADILVALSSTTPNKLWVYKHHWQGNKKLQSSWSEWELPGDGLIRNVDFIKDTCILVVDYPDGVYLETIDLSKGRADEGEAFVYRMDRRVSEADLSSSVSYDIGTNLSTFLLPYVLSGDAVPIAATRSAGGTSDKPAGQSIAISRGPVVLTSQSYTMSGDYSATKFFVGVSYTHRYEFSQAVLKTSSGTGGIATALAGRLQVKKWHVNVQDTGYFAAEVWPEGRSEPFVRYFTGSTLGGTNSILGELPLRNGNLSFTVNSKSDKVRIALTNDSFLPSAFTAAEWEGRFTRNSSKA